MALVEVIEVEHATQPVFVAEFDFLPRVGEHLARDTEGSFQNCNIIKIWHRQDTEDGPSGRACLSHSTIDHAGFVHAAWKPFKIVDLDEAGVRCGLLKRPNLHNAVSHGTRRPRYEVDRGGKVSSFDQGTACDW